MVEPVDYLNEGDYQQASQQQESYQQEQEQEPEVVPCCECDCQMYIESYVPQDNLCPNCKNKKNMQEIYNKIKACKGCKLIDTCTNKVCGEGSFETDRILFIGEGPGKEEDEAGRPFIGNSGTILDMLLEKVDLDKKEHYFTNIVKCRPPENRNPRPEEIEKCLPFLMNQIELLKPKYIVCLGNHAVNALFTYFSISNSIKPISQIHGQLNIGISPKGKDVLYSRVKLIPMYHPAVALYRPELRQDMVADMEKLANEYKYDDNLPF